MYYILKNRINTTKYDRGVHDRPNIIYRLATFFVSAEHKRHRHRGTIMTCDIIQ